MDPDNAGQYERSAAAYLTELDALEGYAVSQLSLIPEEHRFLVTNHDSLTYFAQAYGFTLLGAVIPSLPGRRW